MRSLTWKRVTAGVYASETADGLGLEIYKVETLTPCTFTAKYGGYCWKHALELVGGFYRPTYTGPDRRNTPCGGTRKQPAQWRLKARLQTNDHCTNTWVVDTPTTTTLRKAKVAAQAYLDSRTAERQGVPAG